MWNTTVEAAPPLAHTDATPRSDIRHAVLSFSTAKTSDLHYDPPISLRNTAFRPFRRLCRLIHCATSRVERHADDMAQYGGDVSAQ